MISDDMPDHIPFIDSKFLDRLACYSFFSWLKHGIGCVIVQEPANGVALDDIVEDLIDYMPFKNTDLFPKEAVRMVKAYDPSQEAVAVLRIKDGRQISLKLNTKHLGISPIESYRKWSRLDGKGRFIPGELLYLKGLADGVEEGHYVFLGRQGAMMRICEAGIEDDQGVTLTTAEYMVHSDFEECFEPVMGIIVENVLK